MQSFIKLTLITLILISSIDSKADARKKYIEKYKATAIQEMKKTGIPASISLAQGILESGSGLSELAVYANNHFGIKCHDWTGESYTMDDDTKNECFRKYKNAHESWTDHSSFLTTRSRYATLFELKPTDYKSWAKGLKSAGYATNPKYAELLISIIEDEELYKYDTDKINKDTTDTQISETTDITSDNISYKDRITMRNGVPCIIIQKGDNYYQIANYFGIKVDKLQKYNETESSDLFIGNAVYTKRKKRRIKEGEEIHIVKEGESLYSISQLHGIRVKNLAKQNYFELSDSLVAGEKIYLKGKAKLY